MRFSAAVVFAVAAATPAAAFVPRSFGVQKSSASSQATFSLKVLKKDDEIIANAVHQSMQDILAQSSSPAASTRAAIAAEESATRVAAIATRSQAAAYLSKYQNQSGAAIVYSKLEEYGVTVVNGFSGGAVLPVLDQFHPTHPRHAKSKNKLIRWITNSNEASSGHIAEGYAKSIPIDKSNLPVGVVIATSGPGVTNLITPLQDAICDGVPMVVLCGQAATVAPKDAFQSSPAVDLTRPCTKWSYQIKSAAELPMVLDYAFYLARHGRPGPVFIDLPKDLQNQIVTSSLIDSFVETNLGDAHQHHYSSAKESNDDDDDESSPPSFVRLVKRYNNKGEIFQAIHLGTPNKGLAFEVAKQPNGQLNLQPVQAPAEPNDKFHADHHPSNHIYKTEIVQNGKKIKTVKEGVLTIGGSITTEMINLIKRAKKPIIIAGQGCNDASAELAAFAETLQIPVTTTLHALGCFDERNPLALNMMGMHGHATPNFLVQESDLIICIGSRFDDRITGRMSDFATEARTAASEGRGGIIHVDIRLTEHAKQVEPTFFVHSTGKHFLETMNEALRGYANTNKPVTGPWVKHMKELQQNFPIKIPHFAPIEVQVVDEATGRETTVHQTRMSAQSVVYEMNRQLVEAGKIDDAIFTTGVGVHQMIAAQFITWTRPRQMLSSGSLGTMGVSLGYAIGAKLANPGKIVISVDGDGSFNMTFTELKTLIEHGVPIKILILDNDGQMMVEYWQRLFHDNRLLAVRNTANPDYVKLAGAFGIKALYCDHEEDLPEKLNEFLFGDPDQPVLLHARIERTPCLPMVAPGQPLQDMILEDVEVDVDGAAAPS